MTIKPLLLSAFFLILLSACNKKESAKSQQQDLSKNATVETDSLPEGEETPRKDSINLFTVMPKDSSEIAFVSLSDIYPIDDEKDTLVLPNIEKLGKHNAQYFAFSKNYRKRFLSKTNIAETDSVFIYDYAKNKLASFVVKNLKTVAMLNGYSSEEDWPYHNYDFMIGFEINKKKLNGFSEYYRDALAYVGKENPFSKEGLKSISWKKIAQKEYPSKSLKKEDKNTLKGTSVGNTYSYQTDSYQYFYRII